MTRLLACLNVILGVLGIFVLAMPALAFLGSPVRRPAERWRFVMPLTSLPGDDVARALPIWAAEHDAWCRLPDRPVGSVLLLREAKTGAVVAFAPMHRTDSYASPVNYDRVRGVFVSRCWPATFDRAGKLIGDPDRIGSDDMIPLEVKIDASGLWVEAFENLWYGYGRGRNAVGPGKL